MTRDVPSRARRHFLGLTAATGARIAALGGLGSTAPSSAAEAKNNNNHPGWNIGVGNPHRDSEANCILRSTAIQTPSGEVPIEMLRIGDLVATVRGPARPIKWIGRQVFRKSGAAWPTSVLPIRVARGALDEHTPHRDLYLSPRHGLLLDGVLITAEALVNGLSIAPDMPAGCEAIEYFQILLETHEAILAEGAAVESYRPDENYETFSNFTEYEQLYPGQPWPVLAPLAPVMGLGGREHLKALLRLGVSRFVQVHHPLDIAYTRLAARAKAIAS
jgi:hypothetical protein